MSDLELFRIHVGQAVAIEGKSVGLEKSLQQLITADVTDQIPERQRATNLQP